MSALGILRTYAQAKELPPTVLFSKSSKTLTIYDAYPKSIFHFLILPSIQDGFTVRELSNLKALLQCEKSRAKELLQVMSRDATALRAEIEKEMVKRYGFKWPIWTGFHGSPSMEHLHLHVLSADLCSEKMKNKRHYNSFHPKLGFFIDVDDVLSWFDEDESRFLELAALDKHKYEPILKEDLTCFHCEESMKNMPILKAHLQNEWDGLEQREKKRLERKRKQEEHSAVSKDAKVQKTESHQSPQDLL